MQFLDPIDYTVPGFGELYDELPLWSAPFGLMLLDRVPIGPRLRILDVGAGTGFATLELAQRCGPDAHVIAVDPWTAGLSRLRRKMDHVGVDNVTLVEGDAAHLDLPDESIDLVVSNLGINNFENADAVLRECFRVARSGAKLVLTSNLVGHMEEFYEVYRETLTELGQLDHLPVLEAHIAHRGKTETQADKIERAGFEISGVTTDAFRMRFASGSSLLRHYFIRLGFVGAWKEIVPPEAARETFEALERNLNAVASERGELEVTIPMVCFEAEK